MIYLDSAATTVQKPSQVAAAVRDAVRELATPGRGGHAWAQRAAETAYACRRLAAELFDAQGPERIVFTSNATHALNIAIGTLVHPGMRVVVTGYEHNAVIRPLAAAGADTIPVRSPLFLPYEAILAFRQALTPETGACIVNHVSNVFGYLQPLEEIAELCGERGIPLVVDASQSAGTVPLSIRRLNAAFLAMPGHKGLYGPQGTGLLVCGIPPKPLLYGGTGSASLPVTMPADPPESSEAGTHNMPGIAGLLQGLRYVAGLTPERIGAHERELLRIACPALAAIPGVRVYSDPTGTCQMGALSFTADWTSPEELGQALADMGIAVRAGLHCAPLAHETAGTLPAGTIRASVSAFNLPRDIWELVRAVRQCAHTEK